MRLSLIISTYENPGPLARVLDAVRRQSRLPDEVLISDDGSTAPTRELVERSRSGWPTPLLHVWHEKRGFRKTTILNKSIAAASGDYLVFLDADCVPHRRFAADHAGLAEPGFWVQGRRCFVAEAFAAQFEGDRTPIWAWILRGRITGVMKAIRYPLPIIRRNCEQRGIIGCNMSFWKTDLLAVNGFDEEYTGWGIGEDSDIGTRLYHLGRPRKFVYGRAIVYHLNHPMLPRDHFPASQERLRQTLSTRKIRCETGLGQYLPGVGVAS